MLVVSGSGKEIGCFFLLLISSKFGALAQIASNCSSSEALEGVLAWSIESGEEWWGEDGADGLIADDGGLVAGVIELFEDALLLDEDEMLLNGEVGVAITGAEDWLDGEIRLDDELLLNTGVALFREFGVGSAEGLKELLNDELLLAEGALFGVEFWLRGDTFVLSCSIIFEGMNDLTEADGVLEAEIDCSGEFVVDEVVIGMVAVFKEWLNEKPGLEDELLEDGVRLGAGVVFVWVVVVDEVLDPYEEVPVDNRLFEDGLLGEAVVFNGVLVVVFAVLDEEALTVEKRFSKEVLWFCWHSLQEPINPSSNWLAGDASKGALRSKWDDGPFLNPLVLSDWVLDRYEEVPVNNELFDNDALLSADGIVVLDVRPERSLGRCEGEDLVFREYWKLENSSSLSSLTTTVFKFVFTLLRLLLDDEPWNEVVVMAVAVLKELDKGADELLEEELLLDGERWVTDGLSDSPIFGGELPATKETWAEWELAGDGLLERDLPPDVDAIVVSDGGLDEAEDLDGEDLLPSELLEPDWLLDEELDEGELPFGALEEVLLPGELLEGDESLDELLGAVLVVDWVVVDALLEEELLLNEDAVVVSDWERGEGEGLGEGDLLRWELPEEELFIFWYSCLINLAHCITCLGTSYL